MFFIIQAESDSVEFPIIVVLHRSILVALADFATEWHILLPY
jgi:hypothetical protein